MDTDVHEAIKQAPPPQAGVPDEDELLDDRARGENLTADDNTDNTGEVDAMGEAAGLVVPELRPLSGIDEVERRDRRRWELDPASKEDDEPEAP